MKESKTTVVQKYTDAKAFRYNDVVVKGNFDEDIIGKAIDRNDIGAAKTNEFKNNKTQACKEMRSKNGGDDLPIEVREDGLSAERIRLAGHRAIKNDKHESSVAYKNLILLIAFVLAMMRKIES